MSPELLATLAALVGVLGGSLGGWLLAARKLRVTLAAAEVLRQRAGKACARVERLAEDEWPLLQQSCEHGWALVDRIEAEAGERAGRAEKLAQESAATVERMRVELAQNFSIDVKAGA